MVDDSPSSSLQSGRGFDYVITGPGRSGTTFLAHAFFAAGYDMGNVDPAQISKRGPVGGGMEFPDFVRLNIRMQHALAAVRSPEGLRSGSSPDPAVVAKTFADATKRRWPTVLKDPRFCETARVWNVAGYRPRHIFICIRNARERDASIRAMLDHVGEGERRYIETVQSTYYQYYSVYDLLLFCDEFDVPFTLVSYPRIGRDPAYAKRVLSPFMRDPWSVLQSVWEHTLYHQRIDRTLVCSPS
jgi:hypothetical protein